MHYNMDCRANHANTENTFAIRTRRGVFTDFAHAAGGPHFLPRSLRWRSGQIQPLLLCGAGIRGHRDLHDVVDAVVGAAVGISFSTVLVQNWLSFSSPT